MAEQSTDPAELLMELYNAIDAKWGMDTLKRRQNALSPRIEMAMEAARQGLGLPQSPLAREAHAEAARVYEQ